MDKDLINKIIEDTFNAYPDFFPIETVWINDHKLRINFDGDNGVKVEDCVQLTRHFQQLMEENDLDFGLEISSPDATKPLVHPRQYKKHVGRNLSVETEEKKTEGELTQVDENGITLKWSERVPKKVGKGKQTVEKEENILFDNILETKVTLKF